MRRAWERWVRLLATREEGTSLALFRVAVGLVVVADLGGAWAGGTLPLLWGDARDTAEGFRTFTEGGLFGLLGGAHLGTVRAVVAATITSALMLAAGVFPRAAAFVTLQGCIAIFGMNQLAGGGHDRLATNGLWLLVLADSGRTLSLGCRARTGRWVDPTLVPAWPRYLGILQLVVMYTATGLQKVGPEWFPWGGLRAIHNMLLVPAYARFDLAPVLGWLHPVTAVATVATWVWESTFWMVPVALWARTRGGPAWLARRDWRLGYAGVGVAFHLGLVALTDLGPFSWISLAFYPCLFTPEEWTLAGRLVRRWSLDSRRPAA